MPEDLSVGKIGVDISPLLQQFEQASTLDKQLNALVVAGAAEQTKAFAQVAAAAQQYNGGLQDIVTETRAGAAAQRQFAGDIGALIKEIRDQGAAQREQQRAAAAAAAERRAANKEAREAAKAEKPAAKEAPAAAKEAATAEKARAAAAEAANRESGKSGGILGGLSKVLGSLQGQVAAAFSIAAVKQFISSVLEAGQATESTLSKLAFANGGGTQAAARDLAFLRAEADRLGLELNSTDKSYGSFVAAAQAANFPLADARRVFLATAGAATTLKLSADDTQGVLLAFTQILSKGTVQAEELRGQIGERLPGAFAVAARAMGVTEQQLNKLLQTGQVKSTDFLPKFAAELQKTFGDGSADAADSLTANLNRIDNEFNAFFLRFEAAAARSTKTLAEYVRRFNEGLDLKSVEGRTRLGEKAAQPGIQAYETVLNDLVAKAETDAKKAGEDIAFRISYVLAEQRNLLDKQREEAVKALAFFDTTTKQGNENAGSFRGGLVAFRQEEVRARERIALLDGEIAKLGEVATGRKKADAPTDLEGLVKRQQEIIKAIKTRQLAATQENKGNGQDYLLGAGGLDEQLKAAEKELDRLLGKVDKAAKGAADRLAAALRALEAARVQLATKAAQAIIKESDDAATRARLNFEESIRQASLVEKQLQQKEAAVRKAGGRGANADGAIDGVQAQQLTALRIAAMDKYYADLYAITVAQEQRLFELRAGSDAKDVDALNKKYDKLLAAQRIGQAAENAALDEAAGVALDIARKRSREEIAIEEARQRELQALRVQQRQRELDQNKSIADSTAISVGQVFGAGTGISKVEAERNQQKQLLENQRKYLQDSLNLTLQKTGKEAEVERAALSAQKAGIENQIKELNRFRASDFSIYKLIFGENDSPELRAALDEVTGTVVSSLAQIVQAQGQAAAGRANTATQNINELTGQLAAEIALRKDGAASNIQTIQNEIKEQRAIRRQALEDQRTAAKEQVIIDTITQVSSIVTASAKVFDAFAAIPFVGIPLGIAAVATLVGAFAASKVAAYNAASNIGQGFFRGGYTGGADEREERGVVHGKEFVHTAEKTRDYRELFEAIHTGQTKGIDWNSPKLAALLPDYALPGQLRAERQEAQRVQVEHSFAPMGQKFDALHERLSAIEQSNAAMAGQKNIIEREGGYILHDPATDSVNIVTVT